MATFNTLNAYDANSRIPSFLGLNQFGDPMNRDPRYAVEAENMDTVGGVLQPMAKSTLLVPSLTYKIETLARLYRRWYTGDDEKDILIAASHGQIYYMLPSDDAWTQLTLPGDWTETKSNVWSWVAYETVVDDTTVDVLLMSNALDGMIMINGDDLSISVVTTPKLFGVIERYAERIWGGAIADDPDMLVYSAPYDATDWAADVEHPEDGAGDITQPSWDGDSFTALKSFGAQLIAFKSNRVWRILGTDPGEYVFKEQFGGGAPYFNTIAVDAERILMLDADGIVAYDGQSVVPFYQEYAADVFNDIKQSLIDQSCAVIWKDRYYCALALGSAATANNAVLIYDIQANTWLLRTDVSVESFLATDDVLYFTSSTAPGRIWTWNENAWETGYATTSATVWKSPWNDFGHKNIVKGGFDVYLTVEVKATCTLTISVETEKKLKSKAYLIQYTADDFKQKRMHFGGTGRRFRLVIESSSGALWRIVGGIQIVAEIDAD